MWPVMVVLNVALCLAESDPLPFEGSHGHSNHEWVKRALQGSTYETVRRVFFEINSESLWHKIAVAEGPRLHSNEPK